MMKEMKLLMSTTMFVGLLTFGGCASKPSDAELQQLKLMQDAVSKLEKNISEAQSTKSNLEKQVADKQSRLNQCQADQAVVKQKLGK